MKKIKNSLQKGSVRYIVFKEDDLFYAVGLEFNIIVEGLTKEAALFLLFDAMVGYVESAKKANLRPNVLNQVAEKEYEDLWDNLNSDKPIPSPYQVYTFGTQLV